MPSTATDNINDSGSGGGGGGGRKYHRVNPAQVIELILEKKNQRSVARRKKIQSVTIANHATSSSSISPQSQQQKSKEKRQEFVPDKKNQRESPDFDRIEDQHWVQKQKQQQKGNHGKSGREEAYRDEFLLEEAFAQEMRDGGNSRDKMMPPSYADVDTSRRNQKNAPPYADNADRGYRLYPQEQEEPPMMKKEGKTDLHFQQVDINKHKDGSDKHHHEADDTATSSTSISGSSSSSATTTSVHQAEVTTNTSSSPENDHHHLHTKTTTKLKSISFYPKSNLMDQIDITALLDATITEAATTDNEIYDAHTTSYFDGYGIAGGHAEDEFGGLGLIGVFEANEYRSIGCSISQSLTNHHFAFLIVLFLVTWFLFSNNHR